MITQWQMYWLMQLDNICMFFFTIFCVGIVLLFIVSVLFILSKLDRMSFDFKIFLIPLPFILIGSFIMFIPSTKQACAILIVPKIIDNQKVQQIPDKVLNLANSWLEELKPKVDKK